MILEWECILDCNFTCEYCVNSRNSALDKPIKFEKNKDKIFNFLTELKEKYPRLAKEVTQSTPDVKPKPNADVDTSSMSDDEFYKNQGVKPLW